MTLLPVINADSTRQWRECVTCGHLWAVARTDRTEEQRSQPEGALSFHHRTPATARVLVIDDVDATRRGLAQLLRLRGFEAIEARNGREGLQLLRDERSIRVVVLDLLMPGSNGYWFREQQLREPSLAEVPVIVFTGAAEDHLSTTLRVAEVLRKPVSVDRLFEAVTRYCAA